MNNRFLTDRTPVIAFIWLAGIFSTAIHAAAEAPPPSLSFRQAGTNTEGRTEFVLEWDSVSNGTYRIEQRSRFDSNIFWNGIDLLSPVTPRAAFRIAPPPLPDTNALDQGFFRVQAPSPEIFSVEPTLIGPNGGAVTIFGQCLGTNASVRIGGLTFGSTQPLPGAWTFSINAGVLPEGLYDLEVWDSTNLLTTAYKLFSVTGQPTPVGEAAQRAFEPPIEPPASPSLMKVKEKANRTKCYSNLRVIPATGEIQLEEEDLNVPGLALEFSWIRTYRSRNGRNTRMGQNWSHCYDISIVQTNGGLAVFDGSGRVDFYVTGTNGVYFCEEIFNTGTFSNGVFTLEFPDTSKWIFNSLSNAIAPGAIARIEDRLGNTLAFRYDPSSRLSEVVDTANRTNRVAYDATGRVLSVTDFSGRSVTYSYWRNGEPGGANGALRSVTSPPVTGTPHTNDFPLGKTTTFTYSSGSPSPRLNHNLLSITDANRQTWLTVEYADTQDTLDVSFDRVHAIHRGEHSPMRLSYTRQAPGPSNHWAVLKTIVNDPEGNVTIDWFNSRNQCVVHRDIAARAEPGSIVTDKNLPTDKPFPSDPDFWETTYEWNIDSLCTRVTFPRGNSTEFVYQRALDHNSSRSNKTASRRSDGNPRVVRERACCSAGDLDGDGAPDVAELVWRMDFDPRFGSPAYACSAGSFHGGPRQSTSLDGSRAAGGIRTKGWDGTIKGVMRRFNQKAENDAYQPWEMDTDEGVVSNPLYEQSGMSGSNPLYEGTHFTTLGTDPRGNADTATYDEKGRVITHSHTGYLLSGDDRPVTSFEYHPNGQLAAIVHPENAQRHRRRDEFSYDVAGGTPHLRTFTVDAMGPVVTITRFAHDSRGNVIESVDPRGNTNSFIYNQLDQLVARQTPNTSFGSRITTFYSYDPNDNLVQVDVENRDETGALNPTNAFITTLCTFDSLNRPTLLAHELTHVVQQRFATNRLIYDGVNNLIEQQSPEAVNGNQPAATIQFGYDVRRLLRQRISAPGTPQISVDQFDYDPNGQLMHRSLGGGGGGAGGSVLLVARDGFGRCISTTDGMGNVNSFAYDANHNLIYSRFDGETNDVPGPVGNRRLSETRYVYDSLDRLTSRHISFFDPVTQLPLLDGEVTTIFSYAANGDCRSVKNDNGSTTSFSYDGLGRLASVTDARQNSVSYSYDLNGNILSVTQSERPDAGGAAQVFVTTFVYDALNRCVLDFDTVGNTNRYFHDSRNNLVRQTDPRGNDTCRIFDGLSRCVGTLSYVGACDAGITINTTHVEYDDNSRVVTTIDSNGNNSHFSYDALGRCISTTRADGTSESLVWSPRSNLSQRTDANGTVVIYAYDELDRCIRKDITPGPGVSTATTFEEFHYDGLSRMVLSTNDSSMLEFNHDSLGNIVRAKQDCIAIAATFDGLGNRKSLTYPSGRVVYWDFDDLNRTTNAATSSAAGIPSIHLASFGYEGSRLARIARGNLVNTRLTFNGESKTPNAAGDLGWRQISQINHQVAAGGSIIDRRSFAFDGVQNKISRAQLSPFAAGQPLTTNVWQHDALSRLRTAISSLGATSKTNSYALDSNGNRLSTTFDGIPGVYTLDPTLPEPADFQMDQYSSSPFGSHVYDRNGNLISTPDPIGSVDFAYDYANRLISVSRTVGPAIVPIAKYSYDPSGLCISRTVFPPGGGPATTTVFYRDRDDDCDGVLEETENGTLRKTFVLPHVLEVSGRVQFDAGDSKPVYTISDELGTALALVDDQRNVLERYDYDDFGKPRFLTSDGIPITDPKTGEPVTASPAGNRFLFRGMEWDSETSLYLVGPVKWMAPESISRDRWQADPYAEDATRCYSPDLGRFVSGSYFQSPQAEKSNASSAFAGGNPWSGHGEGEAVLFNPKEYTITKMEGGRHTPFHNKYVPRVSDFGMSRFAGDNTPIVRGSALGGLNKDPKWVGKATQLGEGAFGVVYRGVISSREAGSGLATGRRTHVIPHVLEASGSINAHREAGSGLATGRRSFVMPHVLETSGTINNHREAGSGMSTGRRSFVIPHVLEASGSIHSRREAGSGLATGRRSRSLIAPTELGYRGHVTVLK